MQNLQEQLKNEEIIIDPVWKKQARNFLMSEIVEDVRREKRSVEIHVIGSSWFRMARMTSFAWRPAVVVAMMVLVVFGGSGALFVRAEKAMPGEPLFVIKKVVEKTQGLAKVNAASKTRFAGALLDKRVNELREVAKMDMESSSDGDNSRRGASVALAVREVENQVRDVSGRFAKMREDVEDKSAKVASTAFELNRKMKNYRKELVSVKKRLGGEDVESTIEDAITKVEEMNNEVLAVLVSKHSEGELKDEEIEIVAESLEEKVALVKERVERAMEGIDVMKDEAVASDITGRTEKIQDKLAQAEEAMIAGEYSMVYSLANDSNRMLEILYGGDVREVHSVVNEEDTGGVATSTEEGVQRGGQSDEVEQDMPEVIKVNVLKVKKVVDSVYSEAIGINEVEAEEWTDKEDKSGVGEFSVGIHPVK